MLLFILTNFCTTFFQTRCQLANFLFCIMYLLKAAVARLSKSARSQMYEYRSPLYREKLSGQPGGINFLLAVKPTYQASGYTGRPSIGPHHHLSPFTLIIFFLPSPYWHPPILYHHLLIQPLLFDNPPRMEYGIPAPL